MRLTISKKLLLLVIALLTVQLVFCQDTYISASVGSSMQAPVYSVEGGIYTKKIWIGAGYDYMAQFQEHYLGLKFYVKLVEDNKLAIYSYNAFKMRTNDSELFFEPGAAFVYDLGKIAPQFTATVPFNINGKVNAALYYGVGLNIWLPTKK